MLLESTIPIKVCFALLSALNATHYICNAQLFQSVNIGASKMYANKVSAFNSIKYALTVMFSRPGFESAIEAWRYRTRHNNTMYDIYDGQFWNEFKDRDGNLFTSQARSLLFTLNVDWFQSSKRTVYSVGAVYLTINNLPRSIRYKKENIILVCVIPGPREPKDMQINNYLQVLPSLPMLLSKFVLLCS
ncbi:hypothetical protein G6F64_014006 [Rhizopus arrhizus]|uniref:Uncharacterized protein n=1 Tax=Rhizopus oryzae TaxID=64495 RepID=A0A9P6WU94_RHIOR|nr:hypothetical protein G6F64_014006 [Rhizopus arrhizus]